MLHCDPTELALVALGEPLDPDSAAHLESCDQCLTEAADLREVVAIGREAPAELPDVPDRVWTQIRLELGLAGTPSAGTALAGGRAAGSPSSGIPAAGSPAASGGNVVELRPRRGRLFGVAAVAAACGALVGGTIVWSAVDSGRPDSGTPDGQVVAQAVLDPLTDSVAQPGQAQVLDSPDGQVIRVDARALPTRNGFYEVWLIDSAVTKLVALGALPAGSVGTFTVPPGVSIEDYPVVDISLEPLDGDPEHSKESLMRGTLDA